MMQKLMEVARDRGLERMEGQVLSNNSRMLNLMKSLNFAIEQDPEDANPVDAGNSVSEIASQFDLSLSTVSHHLKELRNAGLIICEKRGQWVYCRPNPEVLKDIEGFLEDEGS